MVTSSITARHSLRRQSSTSSQSPRGETLTMRGALSVAGQAARDVPSALPDILPTSTEREGFVRRS